MTALAADAVRALREAGLTLAVAESSTGGLIGHLLTEVEGSSAVFPGGVIAYSNELKRRLGVDAGLIGAHGAVSAEVAGAMASAVREYAGCDIGLAVTGVAGPTGGSAQKPVGLAFVALADETSVLCERVQPDGDRSSNKLESAEAALRLVVTYARGKAGR